MILGVALMLVGVLVFRTARSIESVPTGFIYRVFPLVWLMVELDLRPKGSEVLGLLLAVALYLLPALLFFILVCNFSTSVRSDPMIAMTIWPYTPFIFSARAGCQAHAANRCPLMRQCLTSRKGV